MFRTAPLAMRTTRALGLHATRPRMMPVPKEEHSAHTISQRLRTLKKMPVELVPLAAVLGAAIIAAGYTAGRTFYRDGTLRLGRTGAYKSKDNDH